MTKEIAPKPAPQPSGGGAGILILFGLIAFAAAVVLDVGGLGARFGQLFAGPKPTLADGGAPIPIPGSSLGPMAAKPVIAGAITQAWFVDGPGYLGAQEEQKATHAPILIYFRKRPCEVCKKVDHDLLGAPELKKLLEQVIKVRVDVDAGRHEWEMTEAMAITDLPSLVVVSPDGKPRKLKFLQGGLLLPPAQVAAQIK